MCDAFGLVAAQLLAIQASFEKHVATLRSLNYDILDVKATRWHDDYNAFKNSLKDLEVMFQNVLNTAFEGASTTDADEKAPSSAARRSSGACGSCRPGEA